MAARPKSLPSLGMHFWQALSACLALSALATSDVSAAPPEPTHAERLHAQLKEAEGADDKLLAERWLKLVRQRQWVDSTGKYKTFARYVDHDPNLQWVKLLVAVRKGDEVTYKEGTVPLARLGKTEQAVVKRIAVVRKQVEAAVAKSPGDPTQLTGGEETGDESGSRGELQGEDSLPQEMADPATAGATDVAPEGTAPPATPMGEPWRTDFATFASNLTMTGGGEEGPPTPSWGELQQLKAVHDRERMLAQLKKLPDAQRPTPLLFQQGFAYGWARSGLGEVSWEAALDASGDVATTGLKHNLQLHEPFSLMLLPDQEYSGDLSRFGRGETVRFVGRFAELGGLGEKPQIKLYVRMPTDQRASNAAPSPSGTGS
jgi:hypothetical protein